jgi:hypothetical protein
LSLTPNEAADALRDIEATGRRSGAAYSYAMAAPHFILWGVIWVIGYGASAVRMEWSVIWPALSLLGTIGSFYIGWRTKSVGRKYDWRYIATFVAVFAFIACLFAILPPHTPEQVSAFFPILVALYYSLIGIWTRGVRIVVLGIAVAVLTVGGYFYLPAHFLALMAGVGGGGLILGGFWLRSV